MKVAVRQVNIWHLTKPPQGNAAEAGPSGYETESKQVSEVSITEVVDREKETETVARFEEMIARF